MFHPRPLALLACLLLGSTAVAAESARPIRIDPAKVAQLKRMEPLSPEKVRIFLDSGQLDNYQVELVVKHIDSKGILNLPNFLVGAEEPPPALRKDPAPAIAVPETRHAGTVVGIPRTPSGGLDVLAYIRQLDQQRPAPLPESMRRNLEARLAAFRGAGSGEREALKQDLRAAVPACNPLIAAAYIDPIDLHDTVSLWKSVAWNENPGAAGYIAAAHQQAVHTANPVLIAYAKDVGGLILRRRQGREQPSQLWYESRDLRELILDLEKAIAQCSGVRAVTYLSDVFAARYHDSEAPMRDSDRDKKRIVQASGGNKESFNNGDPSTWSCSLPPVERAMVAERLVPHLRSEDGDLRDIVRDGLLVVLGNGDKRLKDKLKNARKEWGDFERWYHERREQLLGEAR